jgi:hypothetical protein
MFTEK